MLVVEIYALVLGLVVVHMLAHEAAHALACVALGVRVSAIELFGAPVVSLGRVGLGLNPFGRGTVWHAEASPGRRVAIALAGPAAGVALMLLAACFGPGPAWTTAGTAGVFLALASSASDFRSLGCDTLILVGRPQESLRFAAFCARIAHWSAAIDASLVELFHQRVHLRRRPAAR